MNVELLVEWHKYIDSLGLSFSMSQELSFATKYGINPKDVLEALLLAYFWKNTDVLKIISMKINEGRQKEAYD